MHILHIYFYFSQLLKKYRVYYFSNTFMNMQVVVHTIKYCIYFVSSHLPYSPHDKYAHCVRVFKIKKEQFAFYLHQTLVRISL